MNISRDFISSENREFKFKLGSTLASALAGFVAGVITASIIFVAIIQVYADVLVG